METYPANPHGKPEPKKPEPKKVEKVIEGEVIVRKKSLGKRFVETFTGGDARGVWEYVLLEVLIPAAKDTIADATSQGVEKMIFGEARSNSRRRSSYSQSNANYTSYNRYSQQQATRYTPRDDPRMNRKSRATHNFDEIILATRVEAIEIINRMNELVDRYGSASVSDLYDLVGVASEFTDGKWGWVDLRGADVTRIRQGYLLDLPRPEALD